MLKASKTSAEINCKFCLPSCCCWVAIHRNCIQCSIGNAACLDSCQCILSAGGKRDRKTWGIFLKDCRSVCPSFLCSPAVTLIQKKTFCCPFCDETTFTNCLHALTSLYLCYRSPITSHAFQQNVALGLRAQSTTPLISVAAALQCIGWPRRDNHPVETLLQPVWNNMHDVQNHCSCADPWTHSVAT